MVLTVDGCGNCSSAAWRYLDSMLHREPGTDIRQCRSTHHYIRGPLARLDIAHAAAANAASRKPLQAKAAINISALQAPECFCHLHSGLPPPLARPQRAAKLRSGSMVCGKEDWVDWPAQWSNPAVVADPGRPVGWDARPGPQAGIQKNAARPGMNPAGGNMKGGGILLSRIAAQYHRRNRA